MESQVKIFIIINQVAYNLLLSVPLKNNLQSTAKDFKLILILQGNLVQELSGKARGGSTASQCDHAISKDIYGSQCMILS